MGKLYPLPKYRTKLVREDAIDAPTISTPEIAARVIQDQVVEEWQEVLIVLTLDIKNHARGYHEVYRGTPCGTAVKVADVFRCAILDVAQAIIVAHNHPSGDPSPSAEDIHITKQLVDAGRLLDIEVLDHLIIAPDRWVSLRERGLGFGS